ncbi:thiol reductant ABC exporter subunit CydD [Acidocella sp.]|uniref:thiol reductant ABC exporter subunit CydD n=1 Tax=Acidocella sp. TaxID=50710 RepID=UPI003D015C66
MATHNAPLPRAQSKKLDGWLRARASRLRLPLAAAVGLGALGGLFLVLQSWLLARLIDGAVFHRMGLAAAWPLLWGMLAVFLAKAVSGFGSEICAFEAAARAKRELRQALHEKLERLGPGFASVQRPGELTALFTDGIDRLDQYYAAYLPQSALAVFIPASILVFVFPADWVSGVIMLGSAPLIPLFMIIIGKGTERLNQRQWRRLAALSAHFFDVIEGLTTLKLFNVSRLESQIVGRIAEDYRRGVMEVLRIAFLSALVLEFFATISIAMVAVYIGFRLYYGEMWFLPGFFVLLLAPEFYRPLRAMGTQYHARMEAIAAAEQILTLLETPEPPIRPAGQVLPAGRIGEVRLCGVSFGYRPGEPVLRDIDLTIRRGELVALVGASGGGKSTLARLLVGLAMPSAGRVEVDGADLRDIAPDEWRRRVAWMPQMPTLFHGTIAENIRLASPQASDAALRHAAGAANADGFIRALPQGYGTVLGEHGQGLSGGQIRRVALARAILKDADFVVLDEPDASLDAASAGRIGAAIAELAQDRAVLMIAHRLESVAAADRIVVVEQGRIVETGSHAALLARDGAYAKTLALYQDMDS